VSRDRRAGRARVASPVPPGPLSPSPDATPVGRLQVPTRINGSRLPARAPAPIFSPVQASSFLSCSWLGWAQEKLMLSALVQSFRARGVSSFEEEAQFSSKFFRGCDIASGENAIPRARAEPCCCVRICCFSEQHGAHGRGICYSGSPNSC
jgi:hypothetical protein